MRANDNQNVGGCHPRPRLAFDALPGSCYETANALRAFSEGFPVSDLSAQFEQASKDVKNLPERPDNDTLLKLYALYKQGSEGDVNGPKPGFFDFVGTAKYEAWNKLAGTSQEDAMKKYIALVKKLLR